MTLGLKQIVNDATCKQMFTAAGDGDISRAVVTIDQAISFCEKNREILESYVKVNGYICFLVKQKEQYFVLWAYSVWDRQFRLSLDVGTEYRNNKVWPMYLGVYVVYPIRN
jgi:hypothetical protein